MKGYGGKQFNVYAVLAGAVGAILGILAYLVGVRRSALRLV